MFEEYNPILRIPDDYKAGITVCIGQKEGGGPLEATLYFKKSGKKPDELRNDGVIALTASGKLRLDIGKNGYVEIFAEKTNKLKDADADDKAALFKEESDGKVPLLQGVDQKGGGAL